MTSFRENSVETKPRVPRGREPPNSHPEETGDKPNVNLGVSKFEISQGTPGFGVFKKPLTIPSLDHTYLLHEVNSSPTLNVSILN